MPSLCKTQKPLKLFYSQIFKFDYTKDQWWIQKYALIITSNQRYNQSEPVLCSVEEYGEPAFPSYSTIEGSDEVRVFSSPELKAQVSFSDRPLSGVRLSVCKLLYFRLLLQNRWTNFNQTWHKSSLGKGDSSLFKRKG